MTQLAFHSFVGTNNLLSRRVLSSIADAATVAFVDASGHLEQRKGNLKAQQNAPVASGQSKGALKKDLSHMQYAAICIDKENSENLRLENRGDHIAHLKKVKDNMLLAGPFLTDAGRMCGSLLVFNGMKLEEIETWLEEDPYAKAGLFASVEVKPFKKVI